MDILKLDFTPVGLGLSSKFVCLQMKKKGWEKPYTFIKQKDFNPKKMNNICLLIVVFLS